MHSRLWKMLSFNTKFLFWSDKNTTQNKCWHEIWLEFRCLKLLFWRSLQGCCQSSGRDLHNPNLCSLAVCWPSLGRPEGLHPPAGAGNGGSARRHPGSSAGWRLCCCREPAPPCSGSCFCSLLMGVLKCFFIFGWGKQRDLNGTVSPSWEHQFVSLRSYLPRCWQCGLAACHSPLIEESGDLWSTCMKGQEGRCLKGWKHGF